jgi:hypothetical protein
MRRTRSRILLAVLVLALATASEALAGEARSRGPRLGSESFLQIVGSFLADLWEKAGCQIDPFGRCVVTPTQDHQEPTPPAGSQAKAGCRIDPFGACVAEPPAVPKAGCRIVPLGACATDPRPVQKVGCQIDPWGGCIR